MVRAGTPEEIIEDVYQPDYKGRLVIFAITTKFKEGCTKTRRIACRIKIGNKAERTKIAEKPQWFETMKFDRHEEECLECEILDCTGNEIVIAKGQLPL